MSNKKKQPFIISRSSSRSSIPFLDKSLSNSFEDPTPALFRKQGSFLSKQGSFNFHDTAFKSYASIFKTDSSLMDDLIEKYSKDNLQYRDDEFTQQSEVFITKIASDKKIPQELKSKFPLYQIFISICKIFMLNEYEISVFACSLDHCSWKIDEVIQTEEADFLKEFPSNFAVEISNDCKRFIMYLLIITFSLKQYLNEKSLVDKIQAYCEKICFNFQTLFNRWSKVSAFQKFNYSAPEINRKFKYLSKRDYGDHNNTVKDFNMIVDSIMSLTGSYNSKPKVDATPSQNATPVQSQMQTQPQTQPMAQSPLPQMTQMKSPQPEKSKLFPDFTVQHQSTLDSKTTGDSGFERSFSRTKTLDFFAESQGVKIPNALGRGGSYSRQGSISSFFANNYPVKRQNSLEFEELFKLSNFPSQFGNNFSMMLEEGVEGLAGLGTKKENPSVKSSQEGGGQRNIMLKQGDIDDLANIALPMLSKKNSNISQQTQEEIPTFSRMNSTFSFL